ncbi:DUF4280 domain-containing protein [Pelosinus sp. IPA-1]|uniref:DUF4280 domain-containing protein n=1 Tax=Pelosinus sp. IPA-1 TaxID=3029569 RepID=UPI00243627C3|nr:DUF4280 domain-containing protein [Pelosinus sp. IPA-1]GMA98765.1 hypothetical protein PIPA1_15650 [Pelosinus sp. IPA-1]
MDVLQTIKDLIEMVGGAEAQSYVVRGAKVTCSKGTSPSQLDLPRCHGVYLQDKPQLNIMDYQPGANIMPFGTCLKPGLPPCSPSILGPWTDGKKDVLIEEQQALLNTSVNFCVQGGVIKITKDGQE